MKKILVGLVMFLAVFSLSASSVFAVYVHGYYRSNGTYVNGYERTSPDGNPYNNYSYPGNYNPNTGEITGGNASTYLDNYYKNSSGSGYLGGNSYTSPGYTYTPPPTPSCPSNSYYTAGSCQCNYGYVVSGSSCVNASLYCSDLLGIMSEYDNTSRKCECMSGYEYNGSSCAYKTTSPLSYSDYATPYESSYSNTYSCPINSHASPLDSTRCLCNSGFQINSAGDACQRIIINQISNSDIYTYTAPVEPQFLDFEVPPDDIEQFTAKGSVTPPAVLRKCPSSKCSSIKSYSAESIVQPLEIIGKHKNGNWYEVSDMVNETKVIGWMYKAPLALIVPNKKDNLLDPKPETSSDSKGFFLRFWHNLFN